MSEQQNLRDKWHKEVVEPTLKKSPERKTQFQTSSEIPVDRFKRRRRPMTAIFSDAPEMKV